MSDILDRDPFYISDEDLAAFEEERARWEETYRLTAQKPLSIAERVSCALDKAGMFTLGVMAVVGLAIFWVATLCFLGWLVVAAVSIGWQVGGA